MIAIIVDIVVVSIIVSNIEVGLLLLLMLLNEIIVVGSKVSPLIFNKINVIILLDATSLSSFKSCKDFIAFNPNGVDALPRPNKFEVIFEDIYPNDS